MRTSTLILVLALCCGCAESLSDDALENQAGLVPEITIEDDVRQGFSPSDFECIEGDTVCYFGRKYICFGGREGDLRFQQTLTRCGECAWESIMLGDFDPYRLPFDAPDDRGLDAAPDGTTTSAPLDDRSAPPQSSTRTTTTTQPAGAGPQGNF